MGEFSAEWLALREPADHRARNAAVSAAAAGAFARRNTLRVVDLGCGTGSNLRAIAPSLPNRQHWRLIDADRPLLAAARTALTRWADRAETAPDGSLRIWHGAKTISVAFEPTDLAANLDEALAGEVDLVTAAAFFDLVSASWISDFSAMLIARALPLYAVLTYNGAERLMPAHPADHAMLAAFHAHQRTDKGFGVAAGPDAATCLQRGFTEAGWQVDAGHSDWRLGRDDAGLIAMLANGAAAAVAETGLVPAVDIADWRAAHQSVQRWLIGHLDLFARPG